MYARVQRGEKATDVIERITSLQLYDMQCRQEYQVAISVMQMHMQIGRNTLFFVQLYARVAHHGIAKFSKYIHHFIAPRQLPLSTCYVGINPH